jgi:hypothetical protein
MFILEWLKLKTGPRAMPVPTTLVEEPAGARRRPELVLPAACARRPVQSSAPLCEIMGRVPFAAELNRSAPDTGNMETITRHGSEANKDECRLTCCSRARSVGLPDDRA